jgi:hypothetical protein
MRLLSTHSATYLSAWEQLLDAEVKNFLNGRKLAGEKRFLIYFQLTENSLVVEYNIRLSRDILNKASRSSGDTLSTMTVGISLCAKYHDFPPPP